MNITSENPPEITIDDLAGMVKRGFDGIYQKFDLVDKRFDVIDERFEGVDKRFENIESNMATKEDLKRFATKEDLKRFATKEDIALLPTKKDFRNLEETVVKNHGFRLRRIETKLQMA